MWFCWLVDAVAAWQRKDGATVRGYLAFVRQHRGPAVAAESRRTVEWLAGTESWRHAGYWASRGYVTRDPPKPKDKKWR